MDHVLTEHGLRLTYLCDPATIDELDQDRILEDLAHAAPSDDPLPWITRSRLSDYNHLVLATDRNTGRYLGLLGANDGATSREEFLLLETSFVAANARGQNLLRRMLALAILRIGGVTVAPSIIAACTRNPIFYHILQSTARRFTGAVFFPEPESVAISFQTATLAQRIAREICPNFRFLATTGTIRGGRPPSGPFYHRPLSSDQRIENLFGQQMQPADQMLTMLDLRGTSEDAVLDAARRTYRAK
jgi:hypothetical protein